MTHFPILTCLSPFFVLAGYYLSLSHKKDKIGCFILDFFGSDLSKMDQTWSNWISHKSKNVSRKSFHIYKKDNNGCFILDFFGSDLSKLDQTWPNLIKFDQTWSNWISPFIKQCFYRKFLAFYIYKKDKNVCLILDFFWIRSVQNGSNLIKLFGQKRLFGSNGFSAETAFHPKLHLSNLKWLFG